MLFVSLYLESDHVHLWCATNQHCSDGGKLHLKPYTLDHLHTCHPGGQTTSLEL